MHWPEGVDQAMRIEGRARDLLTPPSSYAEPVVLDEATIVVKVTTNRTIAEIEASPIRPEIGRLVGSRGGAKFRAMLPEAVPGEREAGTGLYLLLDDLPGTTLIAPFGWIREAKRSIGERAAPSVSDEEMRQNMEGVCAGFRPGSSGFAIAARFDQNVAKVQSLGDVTDPWGWHDLGESPAVAMRRARRLDVWRQGNEILVDAMFRDSCWTSEGDEVAVHEYQIDVAIDGVTMTVKSVVATPRVLPYPECPAAAPYVTAITGALVDSLRSEVLARLQSVQCCTHLNDALRSLADVPVLTAFI